MDKSISTMWSKQDLVYLATPYTGTASQQENRYQLVTLASALLAKKGIPCISPITTSHAQSLALDLPTSWDFWEAIDKVLLESCTRLVVLCLDGVEESVGVKAEVEYANELEMEIDYVKLVSVSGQWQLNHCHKPNFK